MWIPNGDIDHFVSISEDKSLAYEWSNYRWSEGTINNSKGKIHSSKILDPLDVIDGWFEIILPSLQVVVTESIPEQYREKAIFTIERLRLRDHETVIRQRRAWYEAYELGELTLDGLRKKAPLIASAVEKFEREKHKNSDARTR